MSSRSRRHRRPPSFGGLGWLCVIGLVAVRGIILASGASAAQAEAPEADTGREIYVANCAMCHSADATGMMGMHPALRGAVERLTAEGVEVTIRKGRRTTPPMPAFDDRLSDEQIADVIAYLDTLPPGPRNFGPQMTEPGGMMRDNGMMDRMMDGGWDSGNLALVVVLIVLVASLILVAVLLANQRRIRAPDNGDTPGRPARSSTAATPRESCRGSSTSRPARTSTTKRRKCIQATGI